MPESLPFWQQKTLKQMTTEEWESLCDGCALCCLHKLEDEDTGIVHYTRVACRLLDIDTCCCKDYQNRKALVPDCLSLQVENIDSMNWLPETCAYRLLASGNELPYWHPLVSGDPFLVHSVLVSARSFAIQEEKGMDLEDYLI